MHKHLTDAELLERVRQMADARKPSPGEIAALTLFYSNAEVAVTDELQQRGMFNGDGQLRVSLRRSRRRKR